MVPDSLSSRSDRRLDIRAIIYPQFLNQLEDPMDQHKMQMPGEKLERQAVCAPLAEPTMGQGPAPTHSQYGSC